MIETARCVVALRPDGTGDHSPALVVPEFDRLLEKRPEARRVTDPKFIHVQDIPTEWGVPAGLKGAVYEADFEVPDPMFMAWGVTDSERSRAEAAAQTLAAIERREQVS